MDESLGSMAFPPVPPDELAFAIAFFVSAARRQVAAPERTGQSPRSGSQAEGAKFFTRLLAGQSPARQVAGKAVDLETSLDAASGRLWEQYRQSDLRYSLCARVLGLYFLMERTGGEALAGWMAPCVEDPTSVVLDPAVVEALAVVPLLQDGQLPDSRFVELIDQIAASTVPEDL